MAASSPSDGGPGPVPVEAETPVLPGVVVQLRKPHPCGGLEWKVTRVGADVGLECLKCGRRVLLVREEFRRRLLRVLRGPAG